MSDFLAYRIPNDSVVKRVGKFNLIREDENHAEGFIFSNFNQNKQYVFTPNQSDFQSAFQIHLSKKEPKVISKEKYLLFGNRIIEFLRDQSFNKFVFSRIKKTHFDSKKTLQLFDSLCGNYPKAFVYLISSEAEGTWIGATPETLLQSFNDSGFTMALAGTKEKQILSAWTQKEYNEQNWVSEYIMETLKLNGILNIENHGPYDSEAGNLIHLRTDFSFDLKNHNVLSIARNLHPTPAVSGLPKAEAVALINQIESHELGYSRDLYTGFIGVTGEETTQLFVNLRCCQIFNDTAYLYVGGGYTEDSIAENEWEETESKSKTLISVLEKL
ncbi:MAG: chorismate-binding protein [Crocinitomicaceae bacterium]|nr:chorismate-binding protein [Crocinitomicaceae bacterium]